MKNFKIVLWVIIVALLVLLFFQNKAFLIGKQALTLDLYVTDEMQSPPLPIAVWLLGALVIGFLFSYFFALIEKFKMNRLTKGMKTKMETQDRAIAQLKQELATSQGFHSSEMVDAETIDVSTSGSEKYKFPPDDR